MIETSPNQIVPFVAFVLSLSPTELTTFYCERCHERLNGPSQTWPTDPFQEDSGMCSHCKRSGHVSNPYINQFLNEQGINLDPADKFPFEVSLSNTALEARLIRDWLIPFDYGRNRANEKYYQEEAVSTWVYYGKTKAKEVRRSRSLNGQGETLLTEFFHMRYNESGFKANPIVEPVKVVDEIDRLLNPTQTVSVKALHAVSEQADEQVVYEVSRPLQTPPPSKPIDFGPLNGKGWSGSTFEQLQAFVSNILQRWKGKKNEKGS